MMHVMMAPFSQSFSLRTRLALLALVTAAWSSQVGSALGQEGSELTPRCGDCWCIAVDEPDGVCPTNTTGITDSFNPLDEVYLSFDIINSNEAFLQLQTADGSSACYPFADAVGPQSNYPGSNDPQCTIPSSTAETVCAYQYDMASSSCNGRSYDIVTYDSAEAANEAGAEVLHQGACGVCSSAQDFGVRIKTLNTLESETVTCATSYVFSQDFTALVECFEKFGFTDQCATLWAHFVATSSVLCAAPCLPDPTTGQTDLNGPPPTCSASECLTCQNAFRPDFDVIGGLVFRKAGITERIAQPCGDFYRVIHEPCKGFVPTPESSPNQAPNGIPTAAPSAAKHGSIYISFFVIITVWMTIFVS